MASLESEWVEAMRRGVEIRGGDLGGCDGVGFRYYESGDVSRKGSADGGERSKS